MPKVYSVRYRGNYVPAWRICPTRPGELARVDPGVIQTGLMDQSAAIEQPAVDQQVQPKRFIPLFTKENAADYARRATAARLRNIAARQGASGAPSGGNAEGATRDADGYVEKRIRRVRQQIAALDEQLSECTAPRDIKALCDAIAKLADLERVLSGRPLPGQRRPGKDTPARRIASVTPLE